MSEEIKIDFNALTQTDPDAPVTVGSRKVYGADSWYITVNLTEFFDSRIIHEENARTGEEELGIFIPIRRNGLLVTPLKKVITTFRADVSQLPSKKYTHILSQVLDMDIINERKKLGFKIPLIGHMRPITFKKKKI